MFKEILESYLIKSGISKEEIFKYINKKITYFQVRVSSLEDQKLEIDRSSVMVNGFHEHDMSKVSLETLLETIISIKSLSDNGQLERKDYGKIEIILNKNEANELILELQTQSNIFRDSLHKSLKAVDYAIKNYQEKLELPD